MVLTFAFGLALVTGIVFGTAPAWFATRTDPIDALRGAGRSTRDHSSFARRALLIVQAGLSVVLVAGSTMLARSLGNLEGQDFGFEIEGRVLVGLNRPPANYSGAKLATLYRDLDERLNRLPGVRATGLALYNPLTENWSEGVLVAGHPPPKPGDESDASWDRVSRNYLQNLGVTLVRGRYFTAADNETSEPVVVVNEAFVRRFFKATRVRSISTSVWICLSTPARIASLASYGTRNSPDSGSTDLRGRCSTCRSSRRSTTSTR
jgi:hypothetical protein